MLWLLDTVALINCHKQSKQGLFRKGYTFTTIFSVIEFPLIIQYDEISIFYPSFLDFKNALKYATRLRENGIPIPTIDILNGTIAVSKNAFLVSNDHHFKSFKKVEPALNIISVEEYLKQIQTIG